MCNRNLNNINKRKHFFPQSLVISFFRLFLTIFNEKRPHRNFQLSLYTTTGNRKAIFTI